MRAALNVSLEFPEVNVTGKRMKDDIICIEESRVFIPKLILISRFMQLSELK